MTTWNLCHNNSQGLGSPEQGPVQAPVQGSFLEEAESVGEEGLQGYIPAGQGVQRDDGNSQRKHPSPTNSCPTLIPGCLPAPQICLAYISKVMGQACCAHRSPSGASPCIGSSLHSVVSNRAGAECQEGQSSQQLPVLTASSFAHNKY